MRVVVLILVVVVVLAVVVVMSQVVSMVMSVVEVRGVMMSVITLNKCFSNDSQVSKVTTHQG